MDKVRQTVNAALVSRLLLVGYEFSIFDQLKTPIEVADLAKSVYCDERYLREWCEALKLSGFLQWDKETRCFSLSDEMSMALTEMRPMMQLIPSLTCDTIQQQYKETMRTGAGIDFNSYPNMSEVIGQFMATFYNVKLDPIIRDLPETSQLINNDLLIADVGCGEGRSTQTMAKIFTNSKVHGLDIDRASILQARQDNHLSNVEFIGMMLNALAISFMSPRARHLHDGAD